MTQPSTLRRKLAAAASAFMLSLVLVAGTVTMPETALAHAVTIGDIA